MSKKTQALQDFLSFHISDNYIRTKDGTFYFYRYYPPNVSIMTDDEIEYEIENFEQLLNTLNSEVTLFTTDKVEDLTEVKNFYLSLSDEFSYLISDIVAAIEKSEVTSVSVQRCCYFVVKDDKENGNYTYNLIRAKGYRIEYAKKDELAVLMRNYLAREFEMNNIYTIEQEVKTTFQNKRVKEDVYNKEIVKRIMPSRLDFTKTKIEQSGHLRKVIKIKNFPSSIGQCALRKVAHLRNTSFTMRLTPMSATTARRLVDKQIKRTATVFSGTRSKGTDIIEAERDQRAVTEFYQSIQEKNGSIYYINVFIEMYARNEEELMKVEDNVLNALAAVGVTNNNLAYEQKEGFLSVSPLGKDYFLSAANNMPSTTAAALLPFSHSSRMDSHGMPLGTTEDGGILLLDMLHRDSNITNSNFDVVGTSGQGKSYLMKKIITFQYIRGTRCFIIDPENEYVNLTLSLGGTVYNCASGEVRMNPFEVRRLRRQDDLVDDDIEDDSNTIPLNKTTFYQHLSWLKDFFSVLFKGLDSDVLKALMILTQEMYVKHGIDETTDFETLSSEDYPIFSDLYNYIEPLAGNDYKMIDRQFISSILLNLNDCVYGSLGLILNGHTNIQNDMLVCFSIMELLQGDSDRTRAVLFNILTYIWNIITRKECPVLLDIDELYTIIDQENMTTVKYLQSFAKRSRKYDAMLGVCTQQLADCLHPNIEHYTTALFNNASYKFLFYPDAIDLEMVEDKLKLTKGEVKNIRVSNKEHCLLKAGNDKYYIHVGNLPYEKELFGKEGGR